MSDAKREDAYFERRAKELGLPTDPEAYQDGGLGVAATGTNLEEAELIAAVLKEAGVPAWVEAPNMSGLYGSANYGFFPAGPRVLVPMGRMADAKDVVAAHASRLHLPAESAEAEDAELAAEAEAAPPEEAAERAAPPEKPWGSRPGVLGGILLILLGAFVLLSCTMNPQTGPMMRGGINPRTGQLLLGAALVLAGSAAFVFSLRSDAPQPTEERPVEEKPDSTVNKANVRAEAPSRREPGEPRHRRAVMAIGIVVLVSGLFYFGELAACVVLRLAKGVDLADILVFFAFLLLGGGYILLGIKILFRRKTGE